MKSEHEILSRKISSRDAYQKALGLVKERDFLNAGLYFERATDDDAVLAEMVGQAESLLSRPEGACDPECLMSLGSAIHILSSQALGKLGVVFQAEAWIQHGKKEHALWRLGALAEEIPGWVKNYPQEAENAKRILTRVESRIAQLSS